MHVVQLGPFPPPHGGVQTNLVAIRDSLRRHGHRASVINLNASRRPSEDDVYYPESGLEVIGLLWRLQADVVHLHVGGSLFPRILALAFLCAVWPGRRSVLTFHSGGYASAGGRTAGYWTLRGFVFRRFDHIVTVNQQLVDMFRAFGVRRSRLSLVSPFASASVDPSAELPPPVNTFFAAHDQVLTTVGLLEPEYDLANLIDVVGELRSEFTGLGLIIVGSGSLESELRAKLAGCAHAAHVLLFGDMPHAQTLRTIAASRALVRATLYDGDSVAVREALELGTPVVATDNGMRPAGVLTCPIGDLGALRNLIREVLTRPTAGAATATATAARARHSGIEHVIDLYAQLSGSPLARTGRVA